MPLENPKRPLTVTDLNRMVAQTLEHEIGRVYVTGEIRDFVTAASGHSYFRLRDDASEVECVFFASAKNVSQGSFKNGDEVELVGSVGLYTPRGTYQIVVKAMRQAGLGRLYEAFLRLKEKLSAEGLFDPEIKREIPFYAPRIGIVTSLKAAALKDAVKTLKTRADYARIIVYPSLVQGADAPASLIAALNVAFSRREVDVLLLIRGGGSLADLWAYNDEALARTIAKRTIPVITGIGHETDTTIADLVADMRAATPTYAAVAATASKSDLIARIDAAIESVSEDLEANLSNFAQRVDRADFLCVSPAKRLANNIERLRYARRAFSDASRLFLENAAQAAAFAIEPPYDKIAQCEAALERCVSDFQAAFEAKLKKDEARLVVAQTAIERMNPERLLEKGYAYLETTKGEVLSDATLNRGDRVVIRTRRQKLLAQIEEARQRGEKES
ncbi:MAG TPA: exodeoxyribonuclease VII large subunit [Sutterella sp.]|nr:exodeoxyribonuclease VII large subunit [Sutterella sp.]